VLLCFIHNNLQNIYCSKSSLGGTRYTHLLNTNNTNNKTSFVKPKALVS